MSIVICRFHAVHLLGCFLWVLFVFVSTPFHVSGQDGIAENGQGANSVVAKQRNDESESVPLLHDYDEAIEQAAKRDRPILVILGAEWCGPCKQLEKDMALPIAASIFKQWIAVKVDIDEEPALAKEWQVNAVPAFSAGAVFPRLWEASSLDCAGQIDRLVEVADARSRDRFRTRHQAPAPGLVAKGC